MKQDNFQDNQIPTPQALGVDKEKEVLAARKLPIEEIVEPEPSIEVKKYLQKIQDKSIKLPADLKKMGVRTPAAAAAVSQVATTSLNLPLTDDQIAAGLHAQVLSSLRWLAEWCLRQLKKAHLSLKKVHGRFLRVKN